MKQNNKTWFDALLARPDCNDILSSYIIKHSPHFSVFGGITSIEQFKDKEVGNMLKIVYNQHRRLHESTDTPTTMYWSEHSLYKEVDGTFVNQLTINTVSNPINTDIFNILSVANIGTIIENTTYESAHKTHCKKELARQYMEEVRRIRLEEKLLSESYNNAIENVSDTLKVAKIDFRHKKSTDYPTI